MRFGGKRDGDGGAINVAYDKLRDGIARWIFHTLRAGIMVIGEVEATHWVEWLSLDWTGGGPADNVFYLLHKATISKLNYFINSQLRYIDFRNDLTQKSLENIWKKQYYVSFRHQDERTNSVARNKARYLIWS